MNFEITVGLWAIPLLITIISFAWAILTPEVKGGDYSFDIMPLFRLAVAAIVSLASWLVWSLFT